MWNCKVTKPLCLPERLREIAQPTFSACHASLGHFPFHMANIKIFPEESERTLTKEQIAHARGILAQWKVVSADRVTYNQYGWIHAINPKIDLEFHELSFTDDGERVSNIRQIDDFSFKIKKWPPPHKREPVEKTRPQRPQRTSLKKTRRH